MFPAILTTVSIWAIPFLLLVIPLYGFFRRVPVYEAFVEGAEEGFVTAVKNYSLSGGDAGSHCCFSRFRGHGFTYTGFSAPAYLYRGSRRSTASGAHASAVRKRQSGFGHRTNETLWSRFNDWAYGLSNAGNHRHHLFCTDGLFWFGRH